jgi:hypothetical protein
VKKRSLCDRQTGPSILVSRTGYEAGSARLESREDSSRISGPVEIHLRDIETDGGLVWERRSRFAGGGERCGCQAQPVNL